MSRLLEKMCSKKFGFFVFIRGSYLEHYLSSSMDGTFGWCGNLRCGDNLQVNWKIVNLFMNIYLEIKMWSKYWECKPLNILIWQNPQTSLTFPIMLIS